MNYSNENVRRQDRLLTEEIAVELLKNGEYGVMSMNSRKGGAYGIPLSYAWDGADRIYIHCAPQGQKLDNLAHDPQVSFCVVGPTEVEPAKFTTLYESIIVSAKAELNLTDQEKKMALELILDKYSPNHKETGLKYAAKSLHRTDIIRLDIDSMSGKCKK